MTIGKPQIIEAIREINPTAKRPWLERFTVGDLGRYLEHLQVTLEPRGRIIHERHREGSGRSRWP